MVNHGTIICGASVLSGALHREQEHQVAALRMGASSDSQTANITRHRLMYPTLSVVPSE